MRLCRVRRRPCSRRRISTGVLTREHKERTSRLLTALKSRADADQKGLAQYDAEAQKNPAGELDVKLGEVYYGFGDYQNAVDAISRGMQKGQVKHLDEAYVYLGLAQAAAEEFPGSQARPSPI